MKRATNRRELIALHKVGHSNRRVAAICGLAHTTVGLHLRAWKHTGVEDAPIHHPPPPPQAKPVPPSISEAAQHRLAMEKSSQRLLREMALAFQRGDHLPKMARAA